MSALLRGTNKLWTSGQVKPEGIPKIDWSHPLTNGLVFYGFDTGLGLVVDLVSNSRNMPAGTGVFSTTPTAYGTGRNYTASPSAHFASDAPVIVGPPFSFAAGFSPSTISGTQITFGRNATNGALMNWRLYSSTSTYNCSVLSGGANTVVGSSVTIAANGFYVGVGVLDSTALGRFYVNGKQSGADKSLSYGSVVTNDALVFGDSTISGSASSPFNGHLFFGAFWSRNLSAQEALKLNVDPYCFLLPPEGEMPVLTPLATVYVLRRPIRNIIWR